MIKYFVNENQRTVIAVLDNTRYDYYMHIRKRMNVDALPRNIVEASLMPTKFRVEVKCHEQDTFDVEEGKKIAKKRVLENYWRSRRHAMARVRKAAKFWENKFDDLEDMCEDELERSEERD